MHLDLGFGVLYFFWVFEIFCEIYGLGFVNLILYDHTLHPYCIIIMFHTFFRRMCLIIDVSAAKFGLGFSCNAFIFYTSHVHAFFMHTFFLLFPILSMCYVSFYSLFLSPSLSLE